MRGAEIVIHVAAETRNDKYLWSTNVCGTRNLLDAALVCGVEKFVYVSSVSVIGANPFETKTFDEHSPCRPQSKYARSKHEAEKEVQNASTK